MMATPLPVEARLEPLTRERLEAVLAVEQAAYAHPWSRANFSDALDAGYQAQMLLGGATVMLSKWASSTPFIATK